MGGNYLITLKYYLHCTGYDDVPTFVANEGRSPSVTRRFELDIYQFVELDETRKSLNEFVPIPYLS